MFDFITVFMYKATTYMIHRFSQGKKSNNKLVNYPQIS